MAEYYPLISRAVAGLRTGNPEARQAIYDRARQALVGQLRAMDPPVPEEAIARETAALDEAIARTESDLSAKPAEPVAVAEPGAPVSPPRRPELRPREARPAAPGSAKPTVPPPSGSGRRAPSTSKDTPRAASPRPPAPKPRAPGASTAVPKAPQPEPARPASAAPAPTLPWLAGNTRSEPVAPTLPAATGLKVEPFETERGADAPETPQVSLADEDRPGRGSTARAKTAADERREDAARPAAPRPSETRRPNLRVWIVAVAALAAVIAIAFTAWKLRDNPEELARVPVPAEPAQPTPGKIIERADGTAPAATEPDKPVEVAADQATRTATEPAASAPAPAEPSPSNSPAPSSSAAPVTTPAASSAPASPAPDSAPAAAPAPSPSPAAGSPTPASDIAIPVAYKAAILVDAPDLPEKIKTYVGSVVWRTQAVSQGQGQPIGTAVQAEISIPEAKAQLLMQIRRNTEAQLPASHTIDLKFTLAGDSPLGTIKQINVPQMRQRDMPTGEPLAGIPVTIADNYFLIGLMRGVTEDRNVELLRSRGWFDIPLLLANGKPSKITFEKGASGERIFNEVLDSWKNAQN